MLRKLFAGSLLSLALVGAGFVPAHAAATVLPAGANSGDKSQIKAFTCESNAQMWLPLPLAADPISSTDLRYSNFRWRVLDERDNLIQIASQSFGRSDGSSHGITWPHSTPLSAGDTYTVTLEGTGDSDTAVKFNYSMTVLDDVFSGEGAGTPLDPYQVTSAAEMNEMRCIQGAYWKLANHIDFSSMNDDWVPLAIGFRSWSGVIDGDGYTISGANFGHPQQNSSSLLGRTQYTTVRDLTLKNFTVTGSSLAALLSSQSRNGSAFHNISVENGTLNSYGNSAGLLVGDCNNGCGLTRNNVQGKIFGFTSAWADRANKEIKTRGMRLIGGFLGTWSGAAGGYLSENVIDVEITVRPEFNFAAIASQLEYSFDFKQYISAVGGLIGNTEEDFVILSNSAEVSLHIETYGGAFQIGGAVGENETPISGMDLVSEIEVVSLYTPAPADRQLFREIAGVFGKSDDISLSRSRVDSTIVLSHADGTNNFHRITAARLGFNVNRVGGVYGDYDDDTADFLNEVHTDIRIAGAFEATEIGGYVGSYDNSNGLNAIEVVVSGSIEVDAYAAGKIGGFVGTLASSGILSGSSVISAVTMDLTYETALSVGFGSVAGDLNSPATNFPSHFYWDATINEYGNPVGHNYLPATTAQLTNRAFVSAAGFDMENSWVLNGSYPELRPVVYLGQYSRSQSQASSAPSVSVVTSGPSSFGAAGGLLRLEGVGLRGLGQVKLGNQSLFIQILSDTSAVVLIPAGLTAGSYDLEVIGFQGTLRVQNAVTITGPSVGVEPGYWTQRQPDGAVKIYAKNVIGEGKVQFFVDGKEIAWVNAIDATDPKLSSASGNLYLVRSVELKPGKNRFEIKLDGGRVWRTTYVSRG
jgi:hypothetical protein